jgi:negative regulator of sigma-B (phosphoserine phosphatase)
LDGSLVRIAGHSRPHPHEIENGDLWLSAPTPSGYRIAIVDGAGHGIEAARVAGVVEAVFNSSVQQPLTALLGACHQALLGTRGAVMSIADITDDHLTFLGVGNVDGLLFSGARPSRLIPDRGMLGAALPTPKPQTLSLIAPWALVLHSDGITAKFFAELETASSIIEDAHAFVRRAVEVGGRVSDDATAVVIHS